MPIPSTLTEWRPVRPRPLPIQFRRNFLAGIWARADNNHPMDYRSWDYQPKEWASRQFHVSPWMPIVLYAVFFGVAVIQAQAGGRDSSGLYRIPGSIYWGFWICLGLITLSLSSFMRYRAHVRAHERPGRLLICKEGLWQLRPGGMPDKIWDADLPGERNALPISVQQVGAALQVVFLIPGSMGSPYVEVLGVPAVAEAEIAPLVKSLNDFWQQTQAERAARLTEGFAVVRRQFGEDAFVRVEHSPGKAMTGCFLWCGVAALAMVGHAVSRTQYPITPALEMVSTVCNWLVILAVAGMLISYIQAARPNRGTTLWITPEGVSLGGSQLFPLPFQAESGRVLDAGGRTVLGGLTQAQAERVVAATVSQELTAP